MNARVYEQYMRKQLRCQDGAEVEKKVGNKQEGSRQRVRRVLNNTAEANNGENNNQRRSAVRKINVLKFLLRNITAVQQQCSPGEVNSN